MQTLIRSQETFILEVLQTFPSVLLLGARQIGKTTLAKQVGNSIGKDFVYFDLELPSDYIQLEYPELILQSHKDKLIIIDEIQNNVKLFEIIRALIDQNRVPARFLLLGSADPSKMKNFSESLAGRMIEVFMGGINIKETQSQHIPLETFWFRGGFPEPLIHIKSDKMRTLWFNSYFSNFIQKDLFLFQSEASVSDFLKFCQILANFSGSVLNVSELARMVQKSVPTINKWIDILINSFLATQITPWFINSSKRLIKGKKFYFRDTGILHFLLQVNSFETLLVHQKSGFSWESFVLEQVNQVIQNSSISLHFYRTQDGTEVDFMIVKDLKPYILIECKVGYTTTTTKSFTLSIQDLKTEHNFVVMPINSPAFALNKENTQKGIGLSYFIEWLRNDIQEYI